MPESALPEVSDADNAPAMRKPSLDSEPLPPPAIQSFSERSEKISKPTSVSPAVTLMARSGSTHANNHTPFQAPASPAPAPVSEEDAQKEANKLTEKISKVKGTVVVSNDGPVKAPNIQSSPSVLATSPPSSMLSNSQQQPSSIAPVTSNTAASVGNSATSSAAGGIANRSISHAPIIASNSSTGSSPQLPSAEFAAKSAESTGEAASQRPSVVGATYHTKQPSVHAHFLLEEVVGHNGLRSRSSSSSHPPGVNPVSGISSTISTTAGGATGAVPASQTSSNIASTNVNSTQRTTKSPELAAQGASLSNSTLHDSSGSVIVSPSLNPVTSNSSIVSGPASPRIDTFVTPIDTVDSNTSLNKSVSPPPPMSNSGSSTKQTVPAGTSEISSDPRLPQDDGKLHILLAATGSISTGKLRLIINKLKEIYGPTRASIQVILTKAAENFVSRGEIPSQVRIWRDQDEWATWRSRFDPVVHIELRRWADILVIAPLSANTLGKIALGLCDNLLTNVVRAWNTQYPILIAPAMVPYAYNNPSTKRHLQVIKQDMPWIEVLKPVEKVVGSYGDIGMGGMMDWNEIVNRIVLKLGGYPEDEDEDEDDDDEEEEEEEEEEDEEEAKSSRNSSKVNISKIEAFKGVSEPLSSLSAPASSSNISGGNVTIASPPSNGLSGESHTAGTIATSSSTAGGTVNPTATSVTTAAVAAAAAVAAGKKKKVARKEFEESEFDDDDLDMVINKLSLADRDNLTALKRHNRSDI